MHSFPVLPRISNHYFYDFDTNAAGPDKISALGIKTLFNSKISPVFFYRSIPSNWLTANVTPSLCLRRALDLTPPTTAQYLYI